MSSKAFFMDYETLSNCSVACFVNYKDLQERKIFVIHELRNDFTAMVDFLENCAENREYHIGFNSLSFDSQISQALLVNRRALEGMDANKITAAIYKKAQTIITTQEYGDFYNGVPEWKLAIPQIDLFKLNHWDFPGRKASLKWLQYTCDWYQVMEMPIDHKSKITTMDQIDTIVNYCMNDVLFLDVLYEKSKGLLQVRKKIKAKYKLNCLNWSNTKMGSEILLKLYCKKTGKKKWDVKQLKTHRSEIVVKDILFPYVEFKTKEFSNILDTFRNLVVKTTKGEFAESVIFREAKFDYRLGGIHQCTDAGIYRSDEKYIVQDFDVRSLHPSIACENQMFPAHLGPEFYEVYKEDIVSVRMSEIDKGKQGDKDIIAGFKEAANATYGNSNSKHSWLNDPSYTMQTTINSQLLISMLVESISLRLTDFKLLQTNTDGCTIRLLRSELNEYYEACKIWSDLTRLKLEFAEGESMFIWDVNNYILKYADPGKKTKCKGRFQFEDLEPHKNKSFLVVPKAIYEFFVNGVFPEEYLKTNRNILDYCGGARVTREWDFWGMCVEDGLLTHTSLQKVVRYYISNKGCKITKVNKTDKRVINLVAGTYLQTEMNDLQTLPWEEYDINEKFYLEQIRKEIEILQVPKSKQLMLF